MCSIPEDLFVRCNPCNSLSPISLGSSVPVLFSAGESLVFWLHKPRAENSDTTQAAGLASPSLTSLAMSYSYRAFQFQGVPVFTRKVTLFAMLVICNTSPFVALQTNWKGAFWLFRTGCWGCCEFARSKEIIYQCWLRWAAGRSKPFKSTK